MSPVVASGLRDFLGHGFTSAAGTVSLTTFVAVTTCGLLVQQPVKTSRDASAEIGANIFIRFFQIPDGFAGFRDG